MSSQISPELDSKIHDHLTCHYCKLRHSAVEAGGVHYCPNLLCPGPGAHHFRMKLKSYQETDGYHHTIDEFELIREALSCAEKCADSCIKQKIQESVGFWVKPIHRQDDLSVIPDIPENWSEDFGSENGQYMHKCVTCKKTFYGNKHRPPICKVCSASRLRLLTPADVLPGAAIKWPNGDWNMVTGVCSAGIIPARGGCISWEALRAQGILIRHPGLTSSWEKCEKFVPKEV